MSDFNFLTGRNNIHLTNYQEYLIHSDVVSPLKLLQQAARDEIQADLRIISSFRDFERQKNIFNNKALGKRVLINDKGEQIDISTLSAQELLAAILRFSAIPGASRHHWGTDFDIYDANILTKEQVQLTSEECTGPFCKLHEWLDEKISKKNAYGFFRPYDKDLGGVAQEKWHLSYSPISTQIFEQYSEEVFIKNIELAEIEFKNIILQNPKSYFERYFLRITTP